MFKVILAVIKKKLMSKCSNFYFIGSKQNKYFIFYIFFLAKSRDSFEPLDHG